MTYCTDSHADFFTRNLIVCKDGLCAGGSPAYGVTTRVRLTEPEEEPLTLDEAKRHLRWTHDHEDEDVIAWITAARQRLESDTGLALMTSDWRIAVEAYPYGFNPLALPVYPIQSVDSVSYYDSTGVLVSSGSPPPYLLDTGRPYRLGLPVSETWPANLRSFQPGLIEVTAGWASADLVPAELKQAMRILIAQSAMFREGIVSGHTVASAVYDYDWWIRSWVSPSA